MLTLRRALIGIAMLGTGSLIGYEAAYLNGVLASKDFIKRYGIMDHTTGLMYLTPTTRSLFSSMLVVGTLIGSLVAPFLPGKADTRTCFFVDSVCCAIGVVLQVTGAGGLAVFIIGRMFLGVALGVLSTLVPRYLMEMVPASKRGRVIGCYEQMATLGNVLANGINYGTSTFTDTRSWRISIAFQLLHAAFLLSAAIFATESPVVLALKQRPEEARKALAILRGLDIDSQETNDAMQEIEEWAAEQVAASDARWIECFQGQELRRTAITSTMGFMALASGIIFYQSYATTFFQAAGIKNSYMISLVLAIVMACFTAPSIYCLDKFGRRSSIFVGSCVMFIGLLVPAIVHSVSPGSAASNNSLIAGSVIFIAAFAPSWGSVGWVTMTEPFSARLRTMQTTITMMVYWFSTWLVGFVTPYIVDKTAAGLGVNMLYILVGLTVVAFIWAYFCLPEFSGLSTSEINRLFQERVPAWKSKAWGKELRLINATSEPSIPIEEITIGDIQKGDIV